MGVKSVLPGQKALIMHPKDNVAVAIRDIEAGEEVELAVPESDQPLRLQARDPIHFGHKIALEDIPAGAPVYKYGEQMGVATQPIGRGEHVHVHNVESVRARGDKYAG